MQESESLLNATRCICLPRNLRNTPSTGVAVTEGRLVRRVISDGSGVQTRRRPQVLPATPALPRGTPTRQHLSDDLSRGKQIRKVNEAPGGGR